MNTSEEAHEKKLKEEKLRVVRNILKTEDGKEFIKALLISTRVEEGTLKSNDVGESNYWAGQQNLGFEIKGDCLQACEATTLTILGEIHSKHIRNR